MLLKENKTIFTRKCLLVSTKNKEYVCQQKPRNEPWTSFFFFNIWIVQVHWRQWNSNRVLFVLISYLFLSFWSNLSLVPRSTRSQEDQQLSWPWRQLTIASQKLCFSKSSDIFFKFPFFPLPEPREDICQWTAPLTSPKILCYEETHGP